MKKLIKYGVCVLIVLCLMIQLNTTGNSAYASSLKEYSVYAPDVTQFKLSGNKLLLKAVKEWNNGIRLNGNITKKKKLSLKLSKDCKWSQSTPGQNNYKYMPYKTMRKYILGERKEFKKDGYYDSGSGIFISVKNGKVIRINYATP